MTRYALTDAWVYLAHGGKYEHADGKFRSAGADFKKCALSGWKKDFCPLAAFLQSAPIPYPNLSFAGQWQPLGTGQSFGKGHRAGIDDVDWGDILGWFRTRSARVDDEVIHRRDATLTLFKSMIKPNQHPHYIKIDKGDDIVGRVYVFDFHAHVCL